MRKPCCDKEGTNKGAWSKQEDQKLVEYIKAHGEGCWRSLPKAAGLQRCGKSCRLRWINYLRPDIKRGNFGQDEEDLIIKLHALLGNRWSLIAGRLPGRTDNEVKNYWNSHIRKKLIKLGTDPNNHRLNQYQNIIFQSQSQAPINDDHDDHDHEDDHHNDHHQAMKPSTTTTVSSSNNGKGSVDQARVERATSGSTSCLDDESTSRINESSNAHLNLNLTMAFPCGSEAEIVKTAQSSRDQKKTTTIIMEENMETVCNATAIASSPTLVLFR